MTAERAPMPHGRGRRPWCPIRRSQCARRRSGPPLHDTGLPPRNVARSGRRRTCARRSLPTGDGRPPPRLRARQPPPFLRAPHERSVLRQGRRSGDRRRHGPGSGRDRVAGGQVRVLADANGTCVDTRPSRIVRSGSGHGLQPGRVRPCRRCRTATRPSRSNRDSSVSRHSLFRIRRIARTCTSMDGQSQTPAPGSLISQRLKIAG